MNLESGDFVKTIGKKIGFVIAGLLTVVAFQNCGDVNLKGMNDLGSLATTGINVEICSAKTEEVKSNVKFLFVIDRSGSNQVRYSDDVPPLPLPGTDPEGNRRFQAINDFLKNVTQGDFEKRLLTSEDPFRSWGLINFSSGATSLYGDQNPFTNEICRADNIQCLSQSNCNCTSTSFFQNIENQHNLVQAQDGGWTSYTAALLKAYNLLNADIAKNKASAKPIATSYRVLFISDGAPVVQSGKGSKLEDKIAIQTMVQNIVNLKNANPGLVDASSVSSAYYYYGVTPEVTAKEYMDAIAVTGLGKSYSFSDSEPIDYKKLAAVVDRQQRFDIKDVWVTNMNTLWSGGELLLDSDADGIPDTVELSIGSSPFVADTDDNGMRDGVEYKIYGKPCADLNCSKTAALNFFGEGGSCRDYTRTQDRDSDTLTDCEEKELGGDMLNFDSNQDYLPDPMAFQLSLPLMGNTSDLFLDSDNDGMNNYNEIKRNTPIRAANSTISGLKLAAYNVAVASETSTRICYNYNVSDLVMRTNSDLIRVYVMENATAISEKRRMRIGERRAVSGSVILRDGDFK